MTIGPSKQDFKSFEKNRDFLTNLRVRVKFKATKSEHVFCVESMQWYRNKDVAWLSLIKVCKNDGSFSFVLHDDVCEWELFYENNI